MPAIADNTDAHRFELEIDGQVAYAAYALDGDVMTFEHTFVPESLRGRGIAKQVIEASLDEARARGLKVVPHCSAFAGYIGSHPETQDLVADGRG